MVQVLRVAVWSAWALHADSLAEAVTEAGGVAEVTEDPAAAPDLLLVDVHDGDVVPLLRRRRAVGRRTIVWGGTIPPHRIGELREAGASGYLSVLALPDEVMALLRRVGAGEEGRWPSSDDVEGGLTRREREVAVAYLVTGAERTRAEVALRLGLSERTVKVHIARIRDKAGHEGTATREGLRHELTARGWIPDEFGRRS